MLATDLRQRAILQLRMWDRDPIKKAQIVTGTPQGETASRHRNKSCRQLQTMHSLDGAADSNPSQNYWRASQQKPSGLSFSKQIESALLILSRSQAHQSLLQLQQPP